MLQYVGKTLVQAIFPIRTAIEINFSECIEQDIVGKGDVFDSKYCVKGCLYNARNVFTMQKYEIHVNSKFQPKIPDASDEI